jgi:hypothetical protein
LSFIFPSSQNTSSNGFSAKAFLYHIYHINHNIAIALTLGLVEKCFAFLKASLAT